MLYNLDEVKVGDKLNMVHKLYPLLSIDQVFDEDGNLKDWKCNIGDEILEVNEKRSYRYRRGPVPRTGRIKRRGYRCGTTLRHPRTTQERRINLGHELEGIKIRGSRSYKRLPNLYDDEIRSDLNDRSWKVFSKKRKQWMR